MGVSTSLTKSANTGAAGVDITAEVTAEFAAVLTPEALTFIADLHRKFEPTRRQLLEKRKKRQAELDAGKLPDFLPETAAIRAGDWKVAPIPKDLLDRRVEITGPVDRKMVINALNSGAPMFMADCEDSHSPTWEATIQGQINLRDAVRGTISFASPEGKQYKLNPKVATLIVRPRGWHLVEKHVKIDGQPVSGSLFDFALYFFHNAQALLDKGSGPYFYLPKMESHLEARLWNDVFAHAEKTLGFPNSTARATVLIETILASFELEEILYELRDHIVGLNCGRWDYIFSFIKKFRNRPDFMLPDRSQVTMTTHFMRSYSLLVIKTCHKRGAFAMGGMAAQIPIKNDPAANDAAIEKVRQDKLREATDGHDGTWVAHPGLVPVAMEVFDAKMPTPNQLNVLREDVQVSAADLVKIPEGKITEAGLRTNVNVALRYLESWLKGNGCVPIDNLMEDAATAEICRAQIWQWAHHGGKLENGVTITKELVRQILNEELEKIRAKVGEKAYAQSQFPLASKLFEKVSTHDEFEDFLTLSAYEQLP